MKRLIKEFERWEIKPVYEYGRISLQNGDDSAREYYTRLLADNPEIEIKLILELAKLDESVFCQIEERAAIRWAENLPGDCGSAVRCAFY